MKEDYLINPYLARIKIVVYGLRTFRPKLNISKSEALFTNI